MTALLAQLRTDSEEERDAATRTYREILNRADNPEPDDHSALRAAMAVLELTDIDVEADLGVIRDLAKAEAGILSADERAKMRAEQQQSAAAVAEEVRDKIRELLNRLEGPPLTLAWNTITSLAGYTVPQELTADWLKRGEFAAMDLRNRLADADASARRAHELRRDNPRLFGGE